MFTIFLNDFGMIWLELTRTDVVQQNYRGVVFCAEMEVLQMSWNFLTIFFGTKETPEASWEGQKSHEEGQKLRWVMLTSRPILRETDAKNPINRETIRS